MNNSNFVSKLILKKTSNFLRISICLFAFSLVLITIFLEILFNQYIQLKNDFVDNQNTHIIEISTFQYQNNKTRELNFQDKETINNIIKSLNTKIEFITANEYQLNFGIESKDHSSFFLYGIDDYGAKLLDKNKLKDFCLYAKSLTSPTVELNIPLIQISDGGLSSDRVENITFTTNSDVSQKSPLEMYECPSDKTYISFNTYKELIKKIYNIDWGTFVTKYNSENDFGISAIYKIFVYVNSIHDVETVAMAINAAGYSTNYTFKSFDNFDQSFKNTIFISGTLITLVFVIASLYIILSFNSYLRVQQKDMGILKHYGYSSKQVRKIYSHNLNKIFIIMAFIMLFVVFSTSLLLIKANFWMYLSILLVCIYFPMIVVNRIICLVIVNSYSKNDVYSLLKTNKEFE